MKERDNWHLTDAVPHELGEGDPFAAAVRGTRMPMVITDPAKEDNPIIFVNQAFQDLTGYSREEVVGQNCRMLQGPETDRDAVRAIHKAVAEGHNIAIDILNYRKDGSTFWNALYLSPVRGRDGSIQFFFASQLDVTDRVEAQQQLEEQKGVVENEVRRRTAELEAALEAKTLLLHEVDHRVKNNLTMIGSLIRLQSRTIDDPEITEKLDSMLQRVDALAAVHRRLYQSEDVTLFDLGAFTENLARDVVGSSGRDDIAVKMEVEPLDVPASLASPLGLIINELLTNALKHAFRKGPGTLTVRVHSSGDLAEIEIEDDGPGIDGDAPVTGLGRNLINRLSRQARTRVNWHDMQPGTRVVISIAPSE